MGFVLMHLAYFTQHDTLWFHPFVASDRVGSGGGGNPSMLLGMLKREASLRISGILDSLCKCRWRRDVALASSSCSQSI